MKPEKIIRIGKKTPILGPYMKRLETMRNTIIVQQKHINKQQATINNLSYRNLEWENEVRTMRGDPQSLEIIWPVSKEDLFAESRSTKNITRTVKNEKKNYKINWIVPPMGPVSGGHADIFRFIKFLEKKGHCCEIYYYDPNKNYTAEEIRNNIKKYPKVKAKQHFGVQHISNCDAIFATSWHTAYPVKAYSGSAKKMYFIQDYEPFFDPSGSYSALAENTYNFGFYGVTLGTWLKDKMKNDYGMKCSAIEFGIDSSQYRLINEGVRSEILFYARPVTPRRGFELGVLALEDFHKKHPDVIINFVGWDIAPYNIPFPYVNHGILNHEDLNALYNKCFAGLVLSFSNMSLLPLELMAAGCKPVVNSAEYTETIHFKKSLSYALPYPKDISDTLQNSMIEMNDPKKLHQLASEAKDYSWDSSLEKALVFISKTINS